MWYIVSYKTPFGKQVYNFLDEDEYRTLMCPCEVLFSSNNKSEVLEYYKSEVVDKLK